MILALAKIEKISSEHFIGRLQNTKGENMKGMIVEANSIDNVKKELITSLKVKIAYDYGLEISMLDCAEVSDEVVKKVKELEVEYADENKVHIALV